MKRYIAMKLPVKALSPWCYVRMSSCMWHRVSSCHCFLGFRVQIIAIVTRLVLSEKHEWTFPSICCPIFERERNSQLLALTVWPPSCHCPGHVPAGWTTCLPLAQQRFPNFWLPLLRRKSPTLVRLQWRCLIFQSNKTDFAVLICQSSHMIVHAF